MPPAPHTPAAEAQDHAERVVALDAGDLAGAELRAAETLVASCAGCAALLDDLAAIRGAMTALPVPPRRRDYRLTTEDAARLRPSAWRRVVEWLAAPGSSVRPLATGLATLGVVGLLLTSTPGLARLGGAASSPVMAPEGGDAGAPAGAGSMELQDAYSPPAAGAPAAAPYPAATAAPALPPAATSSADEPGVTGEAATGDPLVERTNLAGAADGAEESAKAAEREGVSTVPFAALVSLAFLVAGMALIAGRAIARRRLT